MDMSASTSLRPFCKHNDITIDLKIDSISDDYLVPDLIHDFGMNVITARFISHIRY